MAKRKKTNVLSEKKRLKMSKGYLEGGGDSRYARKKKYLRSHGLWGWEIPAPKPW